MDVEPNIWGAVQQSQSIIKKDTWKQFYNEKESVCLETDISGDGIEAGLLWVKKRLIANAVKHQTT